MMLPLATILSWVSAQMDKAGYPVLFGLLLSCGLGVPLPEDIPLVVAGYFIADGKMNLFIAAVCAWCGIIGGDCILYSLGRKYGLNITRVPIIGTHFNHDRIKWAHERFEKYGVWMVAVGRMFAGVRGAMVITAGTIKFTFSHFLIADGLAAIVSGGLFMGLGYWGRKQLGDPEQIVHEIERSMRMVSAGLVLLIVFFVLWQWWKNRQRDKRKQVAVHLAKVRQAASTQE